MSSSREHPEGATDGHFPFAREVLGRALIGCECGWNPAKPSQRSSMQHVSHMAHRRKLGLRPVEYAWPDDSYLEGLSSGGYMVVRNAEWKDGRWVRV
jgi:hypothetical protein